MSQFRNSVQVRTIDPMAAYEAPENENPYRPLRQWQLEALEQILGSDKMHTIVNAPTGSGKTNSIASVVYSRLASNPSAKAIILVPEILIGSGFGRHLKIDMPDGTRVDWQLPEENNLCGSTSSSTIRHLLGFLENSGLLQNDWKERIIVCTNQTFIGAFKNLEASGRLDMLQNLVVVFDEAHHLHASVESGEDGDANVREQSNQLGRAMLRLHERNNRIVLVTATFFRSDKQSLVPAAIEDSFERYNLPLDRWMPQMNHLRSFSYDYLFGRMEDGYLEEMDLAVGRLWDDGYRKLILYIPHRQTPMGRSAVKEDEIEGIVSILQRRLGASTRVVREDGVIELVHQHGVYRVLDLVTVEGRQKRKDFFATGGISDNRDAIDCIIALKMMTEGADWTFADGMVITGEKKSLNDLIQRVGRVLRDTEGKTRAKVVQLLPFSLQDLPAEDLDKNLNGRFKALAVSLLMEAVFCPPSLVSRQSPDRSGPDGVEVEVDFVPVIQNLERGNEILAQNLDINEQAEIRSSLYCDYLAEAERQRGINGQYDNEMIQRDFPEICRRRLEPILAERGVALTNDDYEAIAAAIIYPVQVRDSLSRAEQLGINTDDIDWNVVHRVIRDGQSDPVNFMLEWVSDSVDAEALALLRQRLNDLAQTAERNKVEIIRRATEGLPKIHFTDPLYQPYKNYTTESNRCYDPHFRNRLINIRPDWFVRSSDKKKEILIQMYRDGQEKPNEDHPLYASFKHYVNENNRSFDAEFIQAVSGWIVDTVEERIEQLKAIASSGGARPSTKTSLGRSHMMYIENDHPCFRETYVNWLIENRPEWLDRTRTSDRSKSILIEMAKRGEPKPGQRTNLGKSLVNYIRDGSGTYDADFRQDIMAIAPFWFVTQYEKCDEKKQALLALASDPNAEKPVSCGRNASDLGRALQCYTNRGNKTNYDPDFDAQVRSLRPDWFTTQSQRIMAVLRHMILNGRPKPLQKRNPNRSNDSDMLGIVFALLTKPKSSMYDADFHNFVRVHAPSWLQDKVQQFQEEIMRLTDKPKKDSPFYDRFCNYLRKDSDFRRRVEMEKPAWFNRDNSSEA